MHMSHDSDTCPVQYVYKEVAHGNADASVVHSLSMAKGHDALRFTLCCFWCSRLLPLQLQRNVVD